MQQITGPADASSATGLRPARWRSALAGLLAAGSALAIGELVAGLSSQLSSPVISVGNRVVDAVPGSLKDFAIQTFGTNDKKALLVGIYSFAAIFGLVLGILASRKFAVGAAGIVAFGAVGVWAARSEFGATWWAGLPSVIGAIFGVVALALILATITGADRPALADPVARASGTDHGPSDAGAPPGLLARRSFLKVAGGVLAIGAGTVTAGRWLQGRFSAAASRLAVVLPKASTPAPAVAAGVDLGIDGMVPYLTSNQDFYRIDTNLTVPQIPAESWSLKIKGMVDKELELSYAEILAMPMVEKRITMTCVSNEIGGTLVGNALWLGTPLKDLLARAGIQDGADQIVGRAFDGFTTGWPAKHLTDGREPLLVVGMNGEALPLAHGFPARIIVPGLYGFVSATKWLTEIEVTTFADFDQYWVQRKWSAEGPIKTMARIDTPKGLGQAKPGRVPIAGVAWAQTRGIEKVEVRIDDGPWAEATLAQQDSPETWRQWMYEWDATPGSHSITARATDTTGQVQTEERARPFPNGASGWHSIVALIQAS